MIFKMIPTALLPPPPPKLNQFDTPPMEITRAREFYQVTHIHSRGCPVEYERRTSRWAEGDTLTCFGGTDICLQGPTP